MEIFLLVGCLWLISIVIAFNLGQRRVWAQQHEFIERSLSKNEKQENINKDQLH